MRKAINLLSRIWRHPGNAGQRWYALVQFFLMHWNISIRDKEWIYPWKFPLQLKIRKGYHSLTAQVYFGLSEYEEMSFLIYHLKPGNYFVDVGANLGAYSLLAAGVCGAKVLAIEPWPDNAEILIDQLRLNGLDKQVALIHGGASDEEGELFFHSDSSQNTGVVELKKMENTVGKSLPVYRLDNILQRCPRYIKIDVEGHEWQVLLGLGVYIDNPVLEVIQCETLENENIDILARIWLLLTSKGFIPYRFEPNTWSLIEIKMGEKANTLFVRADRK